MDEQADIAFNKACDYLSRKARTASEMQAYLKRKGFEQNAIEQAVERLREYGFINDAQYAVAYVQELKQKMGARMIKQRLMQKGIEREIIDELEKQPHEEECAAQALSQKYMRYKENNTQNLQRLARFLAGKGFDYDTIRQAVKKYNDDFEGE